MSDDRKPEHLELDEDFEEQKHKVDEWEEEMQEERDEEE
jgi:hypothetical protein